VSLITANFFSKTLRGFIVFFFMSLLLSCGGSQVDVEVGEIKIDREALIKWNEERTGGGSDMSILIETVNEWIQNQALADFLSEYGATSQKQTLRKQEISF